MNKWFRHKDHRNAVAKLAGYAPFISSDDLHYRLTFYHIIRGELDIVEHEEVTKIFYVDPQEAIDTLAKLDYEEEL